MFKTTYLRFLPSIFVCSYGEAKKEIETVNRWQLWQRVLFISGLIKFIILLLVFLVIWVLYPLMYMNDVSLQRFSMFYNYQDPPNPNFEHPEKYGFKGVVNFYVTTIDTKSNYSLSIGSWLIVPSSEINSTLIKSQGIKTAADVLANTTYPVLIYFHGIAANRIKSFLAYHVLRKYFIVVSIDYRGFGDSSHELPPSELGIANDTAQFFKWIRSITSNDIYLWGHSVGNSLAIGTTKKLKELYNIVPTGLILESTLTTMYDAVQVGKFGRTFSWTPWFEATVQIPLKRNGFLFEPVVEIVHVDCPIMILHAKDDDIFPYNFGKTVAEVASTKRPIPPKGNVTFHLIEFGGYGHLFVILSPNISQYIMEFIKICQDQNKRRG